MEKKYSQLREKAEEILQKKGYTLGSEQFKNFDKLIEELNIYHIELEMQNQELKKANYLIEKEKEKYKDFFMEAPVPYLTLNKTGNIFKINKKAAELFDKPVHCFNKTSFFGYLTNHSKPLFTELLKSVFENNQESYTETDIKKTDKSILNTKINAKKYFDEEHKDYLCRCTISDISEIVESKKIIKDKNELIDSIVNNIHGFLIRYILYPDDSDKIEFLSHGIDGFYSANAEEIYSNPQLIWDSVLDEDLKMVKNAINKSALNHTLFKVDYRAKNKKSEIHWLRAVGMPVNNEDGSTMWDTVVFDITKEKEHEIDLQKSENRFKKFFSEDKSVKLIIEQKTGKIINANKAADNYYGYDSVAGKNIKEINILSEKDVKKQMEYAAKYKKNYFEFRHRLASGEIRDVEVYSTPMVVSGENVLFSIIHDITESKKAKENISKQTILLKSITDNMFDLVSLTDMQGNYRFAGKSHEILGYEIDYLLGKNVMDFVHKDDISYVYDKFKLFLSGSEEENKVEYRYKCKDGSYVWLQTVGKNIDSNTIIFSSRDITQIKKQEQKLNELISELQIANIAKDKFVRLLAHDLNSPFNALLGLSDFLVEDFDSISEKEKKELIKEINNSIKNTYNLLENILDWSKIQMEKIEFLPKTNNLYEIILDEINVLEYIAKQKNIDIELNVTQDTEIFADSNMLSTIIRNLINNALKYTHRNGKIKINAVQLSDRIKIDISDTGIGMNDETISKIFIKYEMSSVQGTEGEQGTGFGLSLCKEFMEIHKGEIEVESKPGKGSIFSILFPYKI